MDALYIAQSGLTAQQSRLDAISNNVANLNTDSYKKVTVPFEAMLHSSRAVSEPDRLGNTAQPGADSITVNGVAANSSVVDFSQGVLEASGHSLDIALNGQGFLELESETGEVALSRGGRMSVDADGFLTLGDGWRLASQINMPPGATDMSISTKGLVEVQLDDGRVVEIGEIRVSMLRDVSGLTVLGDGLYGLPSGAEIWRAQAGTEGAGEVMQSYREQSNVTLTQEMVDLIVAQRGFQLNARVIQLADQLLETVNNLRR